MNNRFKVNILLVSILFAVGCFAFEKESAWTPRFAEYPVLTVKNYSLTGNPAAYIPWKENKEMLEIFYTSQRNEYQRLYDPSAVRGFGGLFTAFRQIDELSFFAFEIEYNQDNYLNLFSSMEKDFYDDYFSMVDSTTGNVNYYGPTLNFMYQRELLKNIFLGLDIDYGVERSLKDTFPETITIMRNSDYRVGLEWRMKKMDLGTFFRYFDDKIDYEAVKEYTEVAPSTYFGYNNFLNESTSSRAGKVRTRKGSETGISLSLKPAAFIKWDLAYHLYERGTHSIYKRGSKSYERGYWNRSGRQMITSLCMDRGSIIAFRTYAFLKNFTDWGESRIANTLILENEEKEWAAGAMLVLKPSMARSVYAGGEIGRAEYDYHEYIFSFDDTKSSKQWAIYGGTRYFITPKTNFDITLHYAQNLAKFYWNTDSINLLDITAKIEQFIPFGYFGLSFTYSADMPAGYEEKVNMYQLGLSFKRK